MELKDELKDEFEDIFSKAEKVVESLEARLQEHQKKPQVVASTTVSGSDQNGTVQIPIQDGTYVRKWLLASLTGGQPVEHLIPGWIGGALRMKITGGYLGWYVTNNNTKIVVRFKMDNSLGGLGWYSVEADQLPEDVKNMIRTFEPTKNFPMIKKGFKYEFPQLKGELKYWSTVRVTHPEFLRSITGRSVGFLPNNEPVNIYVDHINEKIWAEQFDTNGNGNDTTIIQLSETENSKVFEQIPFGLNRSKQEGPKWLRQYLDTNKLKSEYIKWNTTRKPFSIKTGKPVVEKNEQPQQKQVLQQPQPQQQQQQVQQQVQQVQPQQQQQVQQPQQQQQVQQPVLSKKKMVSSDNQVVSVYQYQNPYQYQYQNPYLAQSVYNSLLLQQQSSGPMFVYTTEM